MMSRLPRAPSCLGSKLIVWQTGDVILHNRLCSSPHGLRRNIKAVITPGHGHQNRLFDPGFYVGTDELRDFSRISNKVYRLNHPLRDRFEGTITIVRENGEKQGKVTVVNGLLHGEEIVWGEDGKIIERNRYENGKLMEENVSPAVQPN